MKTESKHTKGLWKIHKAGTYYPGYIAREIYAEHDDDKIIATLENANLEDAEKVEANARLIAAAPALYEACRRIVEILNEDEGVEFSWDDEGDSVAPRFLHDALTLAKGGESCT